MVELKPMTSIIVPTFNRSDLLTVCLASLARQIRNGFDIEIIVVDDGSTDDTGRCVQEFIASNPTVRVQYIHSEINRGCAAARNLGIKNAAGDVLLFTDDDCEVPSDWVLRHVDAHNRYPEACGVGGWYWPTDDILSKDRYHQFHRAMFVWYHRHYNEELYGNIMNIPSGNTANQSYKRSVFDDGYSFDERINFSGNVDWEFKQRLTYDGYNFLYFPYHVLHNKPLNFLRFARESIRRGRGKDYRARKYVAAYPVGMESTSSIYQVLANYLDYAHSAAFPKDLRKYFFLFDILTLVGKWVNRVYFFRPVEKRYPKETNRFRYWFRDNRKVREEEWRPYLYTGAYRQSVSDEQIGVGDESVDVQISIVVPVYNRGSYLESSLHQIFTQSVPASRYEVIIVDDGSTDSTKDVCVDFQTRYPSLKLKYVFQSNAGPASARNRGVMLAEGSLLVFLDSDVVPGYHWLQMHLYAHESNPDVVAVYGGQRVVKNVTLYDRQRNDWFHNTFPVRHPYTILVTNNTSYRVFAYDTANMSIKRDVFLKSGSFDGEFTRPAHEDVEFSYRLQRNGFKVALLPNYVIASRSLNARDFYQAILLRHICKSLLHKKFTEVPDIYRVRPFTLWYIMVRFLSVLIRPTKIGTVTLLYNVCQYWQEKIHHIKYDVSVD